MQTEIVPVKRKVEKNAVMANFMSDFKNNVEIHAVLDLGASNSLGKTKTVKLAFYGKYNGQDFSTQFNRFKFKTTKLQTEVIDKILDGLQNFDTNVASEEFADCTVDEFINGVFSKIIPSEEEE